MNERYRIVQPISHVPVCHPAIFWDNGDCSFNYDADGEGGDWSASYVAAAAHSFVWGIRLSTRSTTPAIGDDVWIKKYLWLPPTYLFTLEFLFKNVGYATDRYFYAGVRWYDGGDVHALILRFDSSTGAVAYFAGNTTYTNLPALTFCPTVDTWNHVRLSALIADSLYQYITVNNLIRDARAIPIPSDTAVEPARLELYFAVETRAAELRSTDIDHILLMPGNP